MLTDSNTQKRRSIEARLDVPKPVWEYNEWVPQDTGYYSKAELRRQTGGYESIVPIKLESWQPSIPASLVVDLEEASATLKDFDHYVLQTFRTEDEDVHMGPMSAILLRTESASSSQIEKLTTSARQIALAEIEQSTRINALTVVGNVRAMEAALELASTIDEQTMLKMHRELLVHQSGLEKYAGKFREELVWIGQDSAGPIGAEFIAPQHYHVEPAIHDLVTFANREDLPLLMLIAITHAQFQTIHPFVDGNGRTGRALSQAMLRGVGLTKHITTPISAGLLRDTDQYFEALNAYRTGDAAPIVRSFCNAARFAAVSGKVLVDNLQAERERSEQLLEGVRSQALVWKVLPALIGQPIVNTKYLKKRFHFNDVSAQRVLNLLTERKVLVEKTGLKRNRVWEHPGILRVLDDYAAQITRV